MTYGLATTAAMHIPAISPDTLTSVLRDSAAEAMEFTRSTAASSVGQQRIRLEFYSFTDFFVIHLAGRLQAGRDACSNSAHDTGVGRSGGPFTQSRGERAH